MLDPQATRFWQSALHSGLIDGERLSACYAAIPPEKREAAEHIDRRLARQAVQAQALTLWQAQQLLAGRTTGFKVDRYVLLDLIGQGGMGRVYLARDTRLNRRVALKILSPERINNPRAVARFEREARVGAQLQHENLIRIYDFGEANGRYFLVMEFIEGRTIGHWIAERGHLPPAIAARLVREVALGLAHAHTKGLIHRDVNPYNIMVTNDGTAKLADLGLAIDLADDRQVTREGATVGTFDYVAPEQARHSHSADIRSDIYSLGCSLYHMLCGQVPFPTPSLPEKLFSHQALEPRPLEEMVSGLPPGLVGVVRTMMRKAPEERFATPAQLVRALEPFMEAPTGAVETVPAAVPLPKIEAGGPDGPREQPTSAVVGPTGSMTPPSRPSGPAGSTAPSNEMGAAPNGPGAAATETAPPLAAVSPGGPMPAIELDGLASASRSGIGLETAGAGASNRPAPSLAEGPGGLQARPASSGVEPAAREAHNPLLLDLGPEPPLTDLLRKSSSSRSATIRAAGAGRGPALSRTSVPGSGAVRALARWMKGPRRHWMLKLPGRPAIALPRAAAIVAALGTGALVVAGLIAVFGGLGGQGGAANGPPHSTQKPPLASKGAHHLAPPANTKSKQASVVAILDDPETPGKLKTVPAKTLMEAMLVAIEGHGHVELSGARPLRIGADQVVNLNSARGALDVRAAPGSTPVLEIAIGPNRPFLSTGSAVQLSLTRLEVRARYAPGPRKKAGGPQKNGGAPPLIEAAGPVHFQNCAFQVEGDERPEGACAASVKSGQMTVEGCWFSGFDRALQVESYLGSVARIRQTMIVPGAPRSASVASAPSPAAQGRGWGVELELMSGGRGGKHQLVLEHCTIEGAGLLELIGGPTGKPLEVEVKECVVRADALLAWKPGGPPRDHLDAELLWKGERNQFEILGKSWIVLSAREGTPALSLGAIDLDGWSKQKGVQERGPVREAVIYLTEAAARPSPARPSDFAINAPGGPDEKPGANHRLVGPWAD